MHNFWRIRSHFQNQQKWKKFFFISRKNVFLWIITFSTPIHSNPFCTQNLFFSSSIQPRDQTSFFFPSTLIFRPPSSTKQHHLPLLTLVVNTSWPPFKRFHHHFVINHTSFISLSPSIHFYSIFVLQVATTKTLFIPSTIHTSNLIKLKHHITHLYYIIFFLHLHKTQPHPTNNLFPNMFTQTTT